MYKACSIIIWTGKAVLLGLLAWECELAAKRYLDISHLAKRLKLDSNCPAAMLYQS